ncbi:MAG: hypothetical protein LC797_25330 [Chloroflexi bacterium]|nr:hypothetical protein [Chloroflexota bacterium]
MGVLALALMVAILPSSLHLPITGPPGSAEVAPVPGKQQAGANLSQLGLADSGTVGSGGGAAVGDGGAPAGQDTTAGVSGGGPSPDPNAPRSQCYGNPPRQTEDPLSPPCKDPWKGNNGGATSPGVDGGTIKVLLYSNLAVPSNFYNDTSNDFAANDSKIRRTLKTLIRYFNYRYVTYGRKVELVEQINAFGAKPSTEAQDAIAQSPFAVLVQPAYGSTANYAGYVDPLASHHIISLYGWSQTANGTANEISRPFLAARAPYVYSFTPDRDTQQANTAQWICNELVGHLAVNAGDPTIAAKPRKIGILIDQAQPAMAANAQILHDDVSQVCGADLVMRGTPDVINNTQALDVTLAELQNQDHVTSVFLESSSSNPSIHADKLTPRYAPEWLANDDSDGSQPFASRANPPDQWQNAMGITWRWRARPMPQAYWGSAYSSINPDGQFDRWFGPQVYEQLMQLFSGIQMAGPNLTPQSFQAGLQSYRRSATDANHSPTGFYAPGSYSFLQDAQMERWSATSFAPGGSDPTPGGTANGCFLDLNEGARVADGAWPRRDQSSDPGTCSADWDFYSDASSDASSATQS